MTLYIEWYGKHKDLSTDWDNWHHGTIEGENAADCMKQFKDFKYNHDLYKYTIPQIYNITD